MLKEDNDAKQKIFFFYKNYIIAIMAVYFFANHFIICVSLAGKEKLSKLLNNKIEYVIICHN